MLREDFEILEEKINGHKLVYFDNAATSHKPKQVLQAIINFYTKYNSNIHRSANAFGQKATQMYEDSRQKVAKFINADSSEIIFTSGTTESINFVAATWGRKNLKAGDEIVLSEFEHHSNLVPWQELAKETGAILKFIPVGKDLGKNFVKSKAGAFGEEKFCDSLFELDLENLENIITKKTKLVAVTQVSNVLGAHVDVKKIIKRAKEVGAKVLIDSAQAVPHQKIDVINLDCDFLAFSGHKMLAPTGVGVLFVKKELQADLPPYKFGGGMVFEVDFEKSSYDKTNRKFEAGTPPIAQVIGLGAAIDYFNEKINFETLKKHEAKLCKRLIEGLEKIEGLRIIGPVDQLKNMGHLVSFLLEGIHAHDVAEYLSSFGICTRAGHNCAQPLAKKLGVEAFVRVSFYFYNTEEEVDYFLSKMEEIKSAF